MKKGVDVLQIPEQRAKKGSGRCLFCGLIWIIVLLFGALENIS